MQPAQWAEVFSSLLSIVRRPSLQAFKSRFLYLLMLGVLFDIFGGTVLVWEWATGLKVELGGPQLNTVIVIVIAYGFALFADLRQKERDQTFMLEMMRTLSGKDVDPELRTRILNQLFSAPSKSESRLSEIARRLLR
jgi:hypothetical protein